MYILPVQKLYVYNNIIMVLTLFCIMEKDNLCGTLRALSAKQLLQPSSWVNNCHIVGVTPELDIKGDGESNDCHNT